MNNLNTEVLNLSGFYNELIARAIDENDIESLYAFSVLKAENKFKHKSGEHHG